MAASKEEPAKTEGVINLWRSTREMPIWQTAIDGDWMLRTLGAVYSVRLKVGKDGGVVHFDAPREWWDEHLGGGDVNCGVFTVPSQMLRGLLAKIDDGRPKLVREASLEAARTQAVIESEAREKGEPLAVTLPQTPSQT